MMAKKIAKKKEDKKAAPEGPKKKVDPEPTRVL